MQSNSSASDAAPAGALGGCGGEEDDNPSGAGSNLAALNLSLNCWLHILSKETSADLVVCVLGLVGNLLALFLLHFRRRGHRHTSVDCFVISLALTDLQFVLTLPFWAVDTVLDFRWPFGWVMCKIVSSVTTMNMYASVFFLTAMSVTRYHLLVTSQKIASPRRAAARAKWASLAIWAVSLVATLPHSIYSTTVQVSVDEELCLVRFSESDSGHLDPQVLLGLYQLQKVLLGFVIPLIIISVCYLLLLRFILRQRVVGSVIDGAVTKRSECQRGRHCRRSKVTRSVTVVVLSFFICWLPNQALTLWGVLIKLDLVPFSKAFYNAQAYAFPLTVCLAQANSCLNPVLYCLIRQEYRAGLRQLLRRVYIPIQNIFNHALGGRRGEVAPTSLVMIHKDNV